MNDLTQFLPWLALPGLLLTWVLYHHSVIKDSLHDSVSREHYADRLRHPQMIRYYRKVLLTGLKGVRWLMGRGHFTKRSFEFCLTLSFVYSLALFVATWLFGGPGAIGATAILPVGWPWWQRLPLVLALVLLFFAVFLLISKGDRLIEFAAPRVRALLVRALLGGPSDIGRFLGVVRALLVRALLRGQPLLRMPKSVAAILAGLAAGALMYVVTGSWVLAWLWLAIGLVFGAAAGALVGVLIGAAGVAFAVAFAEAAAFAVGVAVAGTLAGGGALIGATVETYPEARAFVRGRGWAEDFIGARSAGGAFIGTRIAANTMPFIGAGILLFVLVSGRFEEPIFITFILFFLLFPILNALWDWPSWGISRQLGTAILQRRSVGRIARHAAIDTGAALVLLLGLTVTLVAAIEGFNLLGLTFANAAPLELEKFLAKAVVDPWGTNGLWLTLMLLSTLVPTLAHFVMLIASLLTLVPFGRFRSHLADKLEQTSVPAHEQISIAWYFACYWPVAVLIVFGVSAAALWAITEVAEPISQMLYSVAIETINVVRLVAG